MLIIDAFKLVLNRPNHQAGRQVYVLRTFLVIKR